MRKFNEKLIILCSVLCLSFTACGAKEVVSEAHTQQPVVEEETVSSDEPIEVKLEDYMEVVDQGTVREFVDTDSNTVGFYLYFLILNKTDDKVVSNATFTVNINDKDGLYKTGEGCISTLVPGDTGLFAVYFETPIDYVQNDFGGATMLCKNFYVYDVDKLNGFRQTDVEINDFRTESDGVMNTAITFYATNNSDKNPGDLSARVLCKKDGEVVGYAESNLVGALTPGKDVAMQVDGSHDIPSDCDGYFIFLDYSDWSK